MNERGVNGLSATHAPPYSFLVHIFGIQEIDPAANSLAMSQCWSYCLLQGAHPLRFLLHPLGEGRPVTSMQDLIGSRLAWLGLMLCHAMQWQVHEDISFQVRASVHLFHAWGPHCESSEYQWQQNWPLIPLEYQVRVLGHRVSFCSCSYKSFPDSSTAENIRKSGACAREPLHWLPPLPFTGFRVVWRLRLSHN